MKSNIKHTKLIFIFTLFLTISFLTFLNVPKANAYYSNSFLPFHQHVITSIQTNGELVEIDDGSIWKIHSCYRNRVLGWASGDVIELSQRTQDSYTTNRFWISNKTTGDYVMGDISMGPIVNGQYTNAVVGIYQGKVILMNGSGFETHWLIDSRDVHLLATWLPDQAVIIGVNSEWFNWYRGTNIILYNVEKNHFIRAKLQ